MKAEGSSYENGNGGISFRNSLNTSVELKDYKYSNSKEVKVEVKKESNENEACNNVSKSLFSLFNQTNKAKSIFKVNTITPN